MLDDDHNIDIFVDISFRVSDHFPIILECSFRKTASTDGLNPVVDCLGHVLSSTNNNLVIAAQR